MDSSESLVLSSENDQVSVTSVLDEESGDLVEVTPQMRSLANALQQKLNATTLVTALILKKISDDKLYLAHGCGSFKEYAETCLPFGEPNAKKYLRIARRFEPLLPGGFDTKGASMHLENSEEVAELSALGTAKLYELTKMEDADFQEVFTKGKIVMPDGSEMTLETIQEESARKLAERMKDFKKDLNKKISNAEEDKKKAQAERDHYKKELENNEELIERSHELEELYGKEASRIGEIEELLAKASKHLNEMDRFFGKVNIDMDDPEVLQEDARSIIRKLGNIMYRATTRFEWFNEVEEMQAVPSALPAGTLNNEQGTSNADVAEDSE